MHEVMAGRGDFHELAAALLMASGSQPHGIVCVNELVAIGTIDAIRRAFGLNVPSDIQVVGFDDIAMTGCARST